LLSIDLTDYLTERNQRLVQKTVRFILTIFSLFLSSISGNSGQLLFILRPAGQPFSRPSSHVVKHAPKGRPQHVCIDSCNVFHITSLPYLHFFERCRVAPCRKYIHSSFSLFLTMFTKLNSNLGVPLFGILILGTFSWYKFVAKMKRDSSSGSLPWGSNFRKVPQFENWEKKPVFQDFLEFLKGSFVLNIQRLKMEPFTVSRL
jgi:hypothetical protein